jgi:hypothetical protein
MEGVHSVASGGATSPTVRPGTGGSYKRKRSGAEFESSPGSGPEGEEDDHDHDHDRRRQPGVKRACNECRQQKVSHPQQKPRHTLPHVSKAMDLCAGLTVGNHSYGVMLSKIHLQPARGVTD